MLREDKESNKEYAFVKVLCKQAAQDVVKLRWVNTSDELMTVNLARPRADSASPARGFQQATARGNAWQQPPVAQGISVSDMDKLLHSHLEPLTRRDKDSIIYQQAHGAL